MAKKTTLKTRIDRMNTRLAKLRARGEFARGCWNDGLYIHSLCDPLITESQAYDEGPAYCYSQDFSRLVRVRTPSADTLRGMKPRDLSDLHDRAARVCDGLTRAYVIEEFEQRDLLIEFLCGTYTDRR